MSPPDSRWPIWTSSRCTRNELRPALIQEACRIGDRLEELSLQDGDYLTWIGFYLEKTWSLDPLLEALSGGLAGLIFALAYLGSFGFPKYTELARRALKTLRIRLEDISARSAPLAVGEESFICSPTWACCGMMRNYSPMPMNWSAACPTLSNGTKHWILWAAVPAA